MGQLNLNFEKLWKKYRWGLQGSLKPKIHFSTVIIAGRFLKLYSTMITNFALIEYGGCILNRNTSPGSSDPF